MNIINLDDPNLLITQEVQPDIRPQNGLPVLYNSWEDVGFTSCGQTFVIPKDFEYDGMSIPRAVRSISGLEQDGPHRLADLFHDWAYEHQGVMPGTSLTLSRQECDDIHKQLCLAAGMDKPICDTIHFFLGLFGQIVWDRHSPSASAVSMMIPVDFSKATIHDFVQLKLHAQ
jgi:hypothetical protein